MPLKFGTSGVRGLVSEMTDFECWLFTRAFVHHLRAHHPADRIGISGDLRSSTPRILRALGLGLEDEGIETVYFGHVPTPALCLYGLSHGIPTIMVTGSHIPDDRNGIKFNLATGEILKQDEEGILQRYGELKERRRLPFPPFAGLSNDCAPFVMVYWKRLVRIFPERSMTRPQRNTWRDTSSSSLSRPWPDCVLASISTPASVGISCAASSWGWAPM